MRYKLFFTLTLFFTFFLYGEEVQKDPLPYSKNLKEKIFKGLVFSESKVTSYQNGREKNQKLKFSISGLHPKSCDYALKKLSLYESYSLFLDFVKTSEYNESLEEINFLLSHTLLPYDMRLIFSLPRIKSPGVYPYRFKMGILKGLNGNIYVQKYFFQNKEKCLFYTNAEWSGPHTGIPNLVFEFFSQTLAKYSMEKLFQISSTLRH